MAELYAGGVEPTEALSLLDGRVQMLHLRDVVSGSGIGEYEHAPLGEGVVDTERILEAVSDVDWLVYENELDAPPEAKIDAGKRFFDRIREAESATDRSTRPAGTPSDLRADG